MTFEEQIRSHLQFIQGEGLYAEELEITGKFIRCHAIGEEQGRGDYVYKSNLNQLNNGVGIVTWVRGLNGKESSHKTYGSSAEENKEKGMIIRLPIKSVLENRKESENQRKAEEKARLYFELYSSETGSSKYLETKNIKAIGIRFRRSDQYGNTIVIPARDIQGKIITCQNINEDGSKRWLSGRAATGTFHALSPLHGSPVIGICEGYATSATCAEALEGLAISVVCAFDAINLDKVGKEIHAKYPTAKILFLADNDRHLVQAGLKNKGLEAAKMASNELMATSAWLAPDFANLEPLKGLSDWNDLATVFGIVKVRGQITKFLASIGFRGQENI